MAPVFVAVVIVSGCSKLNVSPHANQRPIVRLTQAPVTNSTPHFYSYEVRWSGYDPDGRVEYFRYALDPAPLSDTAWVNTTENRHTFAFVSNDPDSLGTRYAPGGYHTFVIEAVDQKGMTSAPVARSFFSFTVAPEVRLLQPQPNRLFHPVLPPAVTFRWSGFDPDGVHSLKPVKYKFKLFKDGLDDFSVDNLAAFFDSLRNAWPPNFAGWDSSAAGDTVVQIQDLVPKGTYVFAVIAFDEAGAYSPVSTFDTNMIYFYTDFLAQTGPKITMYNEFFSYSYLTGGYFNDPRRYVNLEVAANRLVTFHWSADPGQYSSMKGFRWCMDIDKLDDETRRSGTNDWRHWSDPFLSNTQATVGPFSGVGDSSHLFYIEAEDVNGLKSLGIIAFNVVRPTFENEVLFVNDTRFLPDQRVDGSPDSIAAPTGEWPSRAELDTFLFARGGVRWRYYPDGVMSEPGLFAGYPFDTLGADVLPTSSVPLSTLARYRHVVWFGDEGPTGGHEEPSLRWMSEPSRQNNLALYIGMGGSAWMMGGGTGFNTLWPYNTRTNDAGGATVFSFSAGELVPGRFMYDLVHWRSEFSALYSQQMTRASTTPSWPGMPDYGTLPPLLQNKTVATDPLPPLRFRTQFYKGYYEAEYLSKDNVIEEDADPDPYVITYASMLDTLYVTLGGPGTGLPIMTYYHGNENAPLLFSGFPLWYFRRAQAQALGDWVFQSLWGLQREPGPRSAP